MELSYFNDNNNFHESLKKFFKDLNVPVSYLTSEPAKPADILTKITGLKNESYTLMDKVFMLGMVDENVFETGKTDATLNTIRQGKKDYDGLLIFGVTLKTENPSRTHLADITRAFNREFNSTPVIVVFKYDKHITFSTSERNKYKQAWREGEKVGKISMLKNIDIQKPHSAHLRILADLKINENVTSFNELFEYWQKVFNTKELNKQFFKTIANWYFLSVARSKFPYDYLKGDPKHKGKTKAELQELANQKATIRFITRMIFVWFLKEKGLIPKDLFDKDKILKILKKFNTKNSSNYYNAILQNLFFATLNKANNHRDFALSLSFKENQSNYDLNSLYRYEKMFQDENPKNIMKLFEKIPFLNGGLFDSLDTKPDTKNNITEEIIDGFSRNEKWQASMPDFLFFEEKEIDFDEELRVIYDTKKGHYHVKGLFAIFNEYKFTIEENTPTETDVALDPYLLGEIFENLLAYYNPETGTTARKGSGSFYTPQEIVNYMVEESLNAYLETKLENNEVKAAEFDKTIELTLDKKTKIVKALSEVKILDPACGSGAFPMGVLYKMVDMLKHIDPNNTIWKQIQHDKIIGDKIKELEADKKAIEGLSDKEVKDKAIKAVEDRLNELETIFNNEYNFDDYARKLYIIQNCIYGVDIQDVAIQISKLRFFLSLIVDQKNDDIKPLPNLETKFVIANTLIGIDLPKFTVLGEDDHSQDTTKALKEELKHVREQHFKAVTRKEKLAIKKQDRAIREKIANSLADSLNSFKKEDIDKLNNEIAIQNRLLAEAELMPDMVQEKIDVDLFGGETTIKVNYRKERIKECKAQIRLIQNKIDSLQTNTQAELIRTQALKIAQWDIYNQNAQADWFDMDWMFGINDGFDIVIGNPPYFVFEAKMKDQIEPILNFDIYNKCKGGKLNAFELFLAKTDEILKNKGICCQIFQNSFLADNSSIGIRKHYLDNNKVLFIDSFPERDDPKKRVFESVKMSVCIFLSKKIFQNDYQFDINFHKDKTLQNFNNVIYSKSEIINLDKDNYVFPSLLENEKNVFIKYYSNRKKYSDLFECIEGELNMTIHKQYMTLNENNPKIIKGAQVQRYYITDKPSQGVVEYVDKKKYLRDYSKSKKAQHYKLKRIALQGITGANDSVRIVSSIIEENLFCANSCNYIISKTDNEILTLEALLGIFNSKLTNWIFRKKSTNSNVNCYEINDLILPVDIKLTEKNISKITNKIIDNKKQGKSVTALENQIDVIVYHLYELNYDEAIVVDSNLSKEDFEKYKL